MSRSNKAQSKKRRILKFFLIGCATIATFVLALFMWVYFSLFSGPDAMEMSEYHPFRSPEAKERYLEWYDERAKMWPVEAPPLVLLPGGGATSLMWLPNIEALSESYRTYADDNIYDVGLSVYTQAINSPDDLVNWLDELFSALELGDSINLMGLSYGGCYRLTL